MLRTGKRCPNAAVTGTRYCALPAHSKLAEVERSLGRSLTAEEIEDTGTEEGLERVLELAPTAAVSAEGQGEGAQG